MHLMSDKRIGLKHLLFGHLQNGSRLLSKRLFSCLIDRTGKSKGRGNQQRVDAEQQDKADRKCAGYIRG